MAFTQITDQSAAWAQCNLDTQPSNSQFWDSEDGQETSAIARELGLTPGTTEHERQDIFFVARRAEVEPASALAALRITDWDRHAAISQLCEKR